MNERYFHLQPKPSSKRPKHARRFRDYYEHEVQNFLDLQEEEDESLDDSDSDASTGDHDLMYPILNVTKGQSIALWSCAKVDTIAIFTPNKGETMTRIVKYAEHHLGYDKSLHKLLMLNPGVVTPVDINTVYSIRPGAAIMVMPITAIHVTIEINQLKTHFDMRIDPASTVAKCKSQIKKIKGIPIDQQELLYRDKPMENNRRLLEYKVKNGGTIFVMIQAQFNLLINIYTFWGKTYRFYVDPCSTGTDVVYTVFTRTFSKNAPGLWDAGIHEFYVPIHILVLHFKKQLVHWDFCLAHMGVRSGDTLTVSTVGNHSSLSLKTITVVNEMDEQFQVTVSLYDRWSIVAFMMHGLTNIPVDLIRLYHDGMRIDFTSVIGEFLRDMPVIMSVVMTPKDRDLIYGVPLKISIGNGITEQLKVSENKHIRSIKKKLEHLAIPNAPTYELVSGNKKLMNVSVLKNILHDLKFPLVAKLERFPVYVHDQSGIIYKTFVHAGFQTVGSFKKKIEMKTGYPMGGARLIVNGKELTESSVASLWDAGVGIGTSVFLQVNSYQETFSILGSHWVIKLKIPIRPSSMDIRSCVWENKKIPEVSINCILTFLYWFFTPRIMGKKFYKIRKKIFKRTMPIASEILYPQETIYEQEQTTEDEEGRESKSKGKEKEEKEMVSPTTTIKSQKESVKTTTTSTKEKHVKFLTKEKAIIKNENLPEFQPTQILDGGEADDEPSPRDDIKHYRVTMNLPELVYEQRAAKTIPPPWMGNLLRKNRVNRLSMTDVETLTRNKQKEKKLEKQAKRKSQTHRERLKLPDIKFIRNQHEPSTAREMNYGNDNGSYSTRKRFSSDHRQIVQGSIIVDADREIQDENEPFIKQMTEVAASY